MVPVATASYGREAAERANSGEAPAPGELETLAGHEEEIPQALRKGMAEDAVLALMGAPEATAEDEDGRLLKWTRGGGREVLALVVDGSLAMATETTPWGDETIIVSRPQGRQRYMTATGRGQSSRPVGVDRQGKRGQGGLVTPGGEKVPHGRRREAPPARHETGNDPRP